MLLLLLLLLLLLRPLALSWLLQRLHLCLLAHQLHPSAPQLQSAGCRLSRC
jgi:hypothetical protein